MTTHRICTKCGARKPLTDFSPHAKGKYGRQPRCKPCCVKANSARYYAMGGFAREQSRVRGAEYRQKHPDIKKASHDRWALENPEKDMAAKLKWRLANAEINRARRRKAYAASPIVKEKNQAWREANREKARRYSLAHKLKRAHGLSMEEYGAIALAQSNACAICGLDFATLTGRRPHLDHDHETGAVRQLLCRACNHGIGNFKDDPALLQKAIDYILRHKQNA